MRTIACLLLDVLIQIYLTFKGWVMQALAWLFPDGRQDIDP